MREGWLKELIRTLDRELPRLGGLRPVGERTEELFRSQRGHVYVSMDELFPLRIRDLYGRLAHAVLVLRRYRPDNPKSVCIAALHVDRAGKRAMAAAGEFMKDHAPDIGWAVLDAKGALRICVPKLDVDIRRTGQLIARGPPHRGSARLFTDLNCWMLKVLLLRNAPRNLFGGPRIHVSSAEDLYQVAHTSRPLAYRFVRTFEERGYLRRTGEGLQVTRRGELLEAWFDEAKLKRDRILPVRSIFGPPERMQDLFADEKRGPKVAMAGFYACRLLGVLHTPENRRQVHVLAPLQEALIPLGLEPCDERDAQFFMGEPRDKQSILRGSVTVDRLCVVDILQAAVDVAGRPARGLEQAEYILKRVLRWTDGPS